MIALAHFAQFLAFALGLVAIYIGISSNKTANSKVLRVYNAIIILTNLIILIHVFEAFLKIIFAPEVYDKIYRPIFWHMIIPAAAIRFCIANRFFLFSKLLDDKNFKPLDNYITFFLFALFIAACFLQDLFFPNARAEYIYVMFPHFVLSFSIGLLAIKMLRKKKGITLLNADYGLHLGIFFLLYSLGLFFLRIIDMPTHKISEHTQMAGIGVLAITFNLFNVIFLKRGFVPRLAATGQPSIEEFCSRMGITKREQEIIELISQGKTNKETAELLFITPVTVRDHLSNIYRKTKVKNRTQLASMFRL